MSIYKLHKAETILQEMCHTSHTVNIFYTKDLYVSIFSITMKNNGSIL